MKIKRSRIIPIDPEKSVGKLPREIFNLINEIDAKEEIKEKIG
jgi:hypothetical protein